MNYHNAIDRAILAHSAWVQRYGNAIAADRSDFSLARVAADNSCEFGQWFYGLPTDLQMTEQGAKVQKLHAAFHAEAARIQEMAINGQSTGATQALDSRRQYLSLSDQLIVALREWEAMLTREHHP